MAGNANAQYAIEIAATMGGGEATVAELDEMVSSFTGAGKNASAFQEAIKKLSGDLDTARAAQLAANQALAAGQEEYSRLETAALQASKAAEKAAASEGAISARAAKLAADALTAAEAQRVLSEQLATVNAALSASTDYLPPELVARADTLTTALAKATAETDALAAKANEAAAAEQKAAMATLEAATAALDAEKAVDKYAGDLSTLEVNARDAAKEEEHLAQTLGNVRKLGAHADKVIAKHAESLSKLGGALGAVGGPLGSIGQKLTAPIKGFSELSGVMGSTNAAAVLAAVGIAGVAVAILAVAGAAVYGLGKVTLWAVRLADKEGKLTAQTERLESNFTELFSGLNIDPVIDGMTRLADLFDANAAAGQAVKFLFEEIFQPIIDQAENAALVVEAFFLGFLIGAVKLYIALKPTIKAIAEVFGFEDDALANTLTSVKEIGELLAPVILFVAAGFAAAVVAVTALVGVVGALVGVIVGFPLILYQVGAAVLEGMVGAFNAAVEFIYGIDFLAIGASIVQGLAAGITGAAGAVLSAITGVVGGAINAAKSMLGIASPSKLFAGIGEDTGEGMAMGVDDSATAVQGAMVDMVSPDEAIKQAQLSGDAGAVAAASSAPAASSSGGASSSIQGNHFHFYGVKDAEDAEKRFGELLVRFAEGAVTQLGVDSEALA